MRWSTRFSPPRSWPRVPPRPSAPSRPPGGGAGPRAAAGQAHAQGPQLALHGGPGQRGVGRLVQPRQHRGRRARRRGQRVPRAHVVAGQRRTAGLGHGGHGGQVGVALRGGHGQGAQAGAALPGRRQLAQPGAEDLDGRVDLAAAQRAQQRRRGLVGHDQRVDAGALQQPVRGQVLGAAGGHRAQRQPAGGGPGAGQQVGQAAQRRRGRHEQRQVEARQQAHRGEVALRVVGQLAEQRRRHRVAVAHQQQGVAVGRGLGHGLAGVDAAGAGPVVHHHRLAQLGGQALAQRAGGQVGDAAGSEGHEQRQRPLREGRGLGTGAGRQRRQAARRAQDAEPAQPADHAQQRPARRQARRCGGARGRGARGRGVWGGHRCHRRCSGARRRALLSGRRAAGHGGCARPPATPPEPPRCTTPRPAAPRA